MNAYVLPLSNGIPHDRGEPCVVDFDDGRRFWCKRVCEIPHAPWDGIDAYDWLEGHGWDASAPIRRRETLEAIHQAMVEVGL